MPTWMEQAACKDADLEIFYGENTQPLDKKVHEVRERWCLSCPVIEKCLDYAMEEREDYGIWGGLSPTQRIRRRKRREK